MTEPHATVILAISADGKIADAVRSPARFGSANDKSHLEQQVATSDAVLFGNGTLQAYGTTMRVISPELVKQRELQGKPPQPVQIVCSRSPQFDPNLRFFQQPVPRWLLTGQDSRDTGLPSPLPSSLFPLPSSFFLLPSMFDRIIYAKTAGGEIDWIDAFQQLASFDIKRLAILGGGKLVASVLAAGLVDELWLTVCPLILGGADAPTAVEGEGFLADVAPKLELLAVKQVGQEVFLHYRVDR
ncbi:riboflavin deaminase [Microcoleus vaginatus PCC 9802]|uniref:RibD family protein n=1 Tax=Microcoleus vaginatus TaxID=119532 RepID=UPI00020D118A|nr:bifunctional deaminase-reductase domain protein [Microcoleus vaginatus FGP-2]UNU19416.1 riboflavin deaminase [Microcoleus vaginatus PCC 9802]